MKDNVNHPSHYTKGKIETIKFLEDTLQEGFEPYLVGNILKYMCRYKHKNGIEDLEKAKWYLTKLIKFKSNPKKIKDSTNIDHAIDATVHFVKNNVTFTGEVGKYIQDPRKTTTQ